MIEFICYNVIIISFMGIQLTNIWRCMKEYQYFSISMIKKKSGNYPQCTRVFPCPQDIGTGSLTQRNASSFFELPFIKSTVQSVTHYNLRSPRCFSLLNCISTIGFLHGSDFLP